MPRNIRFAIVEDNPTIAQIITTKLEQRGWRRQFWDTAKDGAVRELTNHVPDVLFLDNNFPTAEGESSSLDQGRELLAFIREQPRFVPRFIVWISTNRLAGETVANATMIETNKAGLFLWLDGDDLGGQKTIDSVEAAVVPAFA